MWTLNSELSISYILEISSSSNQIHQNIGTKVKSPDVNALHSCLQCIPCVQIVTFKSKTEKRLIRMLQCWSRIKRRNPGFKKYGLILGLLSKLVRFQGRRELYTMSVYLSTRLMVHCFIFLHTIYDVPASHVLDVQ